MKFLYKTVMVAILTLCSGCSVYMAANQPPAKNVDLFKVGTPRSALLAEFGYPTSSEVKDGKKYDIYRFTQGYSGGAKAGRAVAHGVASVLTLGLWEVLGTPIEAINSGDLTAYEVGYGSDERVDVVISLIQTANTGPMSESAGQDQQNCPSGNCPPQQVMAVPTQTLPASQPRPANQQAVTVENPARRLEQLDVLRQKGLITQKDYDTKKLEILNSL